MTPAVCRFMMIQHILLCLLFSPLSTHAVKFAYVAFFGTGSSCTGSITGGSELVGLDQACTREFSETASHRISCTGPDLFVAYDTIDCTGEVSTTKPSWPANLCLDEQILFTCSDEPTIFLKQSYMYAGCSGGATGNPYVYSPSVCLEYVFASSASCAKILH